MLDFVSPNVLFPIGSIACSSMQEPIFKLLHWFPTCWPVQPCKPSILVSSEDCNSGCVICMTFVSFAFPPIYQANPDDMCRYLTHLLCKSLAHHIIIGVSPANSMHPWLEYCHMQLVIATCFIGDQQRIEAPFFAWLLMSIFHIFNLL